MSASQTNENYWLPKRGNGLWKVQLSIIEPDFGLAVNTVTGERKPWSTLKLELYGEGWQEVIRETLEHGRVN